MLNNILQINVKGRTKQRKSEIAWIYTKDKKQKGTGGARAGNIKSGTRVGGGRIFGPRPRNYHFKLNVKLKDWLGNRLFCSSKESKDHGNE